MTDTGFNWIGGLQKRGGGDERVAAMTRKLGWRLGFMFGQNWHEEAWGRCTRGVWEESEKLRFKLDLKSEFI
jgi:hypothetical protein